MRTRLFLLSMLCIFGLLATSLISYAEPLSQRTLALGSWGEDVFWLQRKLMDMGLLEEATGRYGTGTQKAVKELQRAHGLKPDGIAGPQTFQLLQEVQTFSYYTVQQGDSLYTIAKIHGISMEDIVSLNALTETNLQIGQKLKVPRKPEPIIYRVQPGDSLYAIAKRFGVAVGQITALNNIENPTLIKPGQELVMPDTCVP